MTRGTNSESKSLRSLDYARDWRKNQLEMTLRTLGMAIVMSCWAKHSAVETSRAMLVDKYNSGRFINDYFNLLNERLYKISHSTPQKSWFCESHYARNDMGTNSESKVLDLSTTLEMTKIAARNDKRTLGMQLFMSFWAKRSAVENISGLCLLNKIKVAFIEWLILFTQWAIV